MKIGELFVHYLLWHYTTGFADLFGVVRNFLWFFYNFFSIPLLLRTLFSPLERLQEKYTGGLDVAEFFSTLAVNIIMRLVGAALRLFVIVFGLLTLTATGGIGSILFVAWVFLPFAVPLSFFWGVILVFT